MFYFVLKNILVVLVAVIAVVLVKAVFNSKKSTIIQSNTYASVSGISSIKHENSAKRVSECILGAEETLKNETIDNFSIENFYDLLNKGIN